MLRVNTLAPRDVDFQNNLAATSEKYRLPTIIITPSSPSSQTDFQVHFYSLPEPTSKSHSFIPCLPSSRHTRAALFFLILAVLVVLHFLMARYADAADHPEAFFHLPSLWSAADHAVIAHPVAAMVTPAPAVPNDVHHPLL